VFGDVVAAAMIDRLDHRTEEHINPLDQCEHCSEQTRTTTGLAMPSFYGRHCIREMEA
jgi:hypothetical protein